MTKVLVDTSAFVAIQRSREREHESAVQTLATLVDRGVALIATNYAFAETYNTLLRREGRWLAFAWGSEAQGTSLFDFVRVDAELEDAAWEILTSHDDKDWSYVDAVSFALMEREGINTAFTFDEHFRQRGFAVVPA